MLKVFRGTVKDGAVKLPPNAKLRNGTKVIVSVWRTRKKPEEWSYPPDLEAEDVAFVKACRRSINQAMRSDEARNRSRRGRHQ